MNMIYFPFEELSIGRSSGVIRSHFYKGMKRNSNTHFYVNSDKIELILSDDELGDRIFTTSGTVIALNPGFKFNRFNEQQLFKK